MTPDEERACYERAAKVIRRILDGIYEEHSSYDPDTGATEISNRRIEERANELEEIEEAILALPLTTESALAQFSTATVQCISGGDTLTEREVPIVGQGDIAQGAAPLEPVAWTSGPIANLWAVWLASGGGYIFSFASRDYPQQAQFQAEGLANALNKLKLYAIPPGYAVIKTTKGESNV